MAIPPAGEAAQVSQVAPTAAAAVGALRGRLVQHQAAPDLAAKLGTDAAVHAAAGQTVADGAGGAAEAAAWLQQTGEVLNLNPDLLTSTTSDLTSIHSSIMGLMGAPAASSAAAARGAGSAASTPAVQDNRLYSHAQDSSSTGGLQMKGEHARALRARGMHQQLLEACPPQPISRNLQEQLLLCRWSWMPVCCLFHRYSAGTACQQAAPNGELWSGPCTDPTQVRLL